MRVAAIDMSTSLASLALIEGDQVLGEASWEQRRDAGQPLFEQLRCLMAEVEWTFEDLDCYVTGRGPGMYSGLRISLTAFQAFALPDEKPVFTLNSGVAIAASAFESTGAKRVVVVGDARRELLWYGVFEKMVGVPMLNGEWQLTGRTELAERLDDTRILCVSSVLSAMRESDWFEYVASLNWYGEDVYPQAGRLGVEAAFMMERGMVSEPNTPIYMHPPVAVVKTD